VTLNKGKAEGGTLAFTVQTASVEGDVGSRNDWTGKLEEHLKSPDFFDVGKFPTATFRSLEIKSGGSGGSHTIKGDLTIRGVTKRVTFPASLTVSGKEVTGKAEFSINRKDFGIAYAGKADDLIRDGVVLKIDLRGTAK
jgi:polyisoprenoid-binding protein YceI